MTTTTTKPELTEEQRAANRKTYEDAKTASEKVYLQLTEMVVEQMQNNPGQWMKPWVGSEDSMLAKNVKTKRVYTGGNQMFLMGERFTKGYESNYWGTEKQWLATGSRILDSVDWVVLIRFGFSWKAKKDASGNVMMKNGRAEMTKVGYPIPFRVCNVAHIKGWAPKDTSAEFDHNPIEDAEAFFKTLPGKVHHRGARAFYSPKSDAITLPPLKKFLKPEDYYSTLAHEYIHWTGGTERLARPGLGQKFGSEEYAKEELVAELGSVFVCNDLGIAAEPRKDHAQYLATWIKVLQNDVGLIWKASQAAMKGVRLLNDLSKEAA